MGTEEIIVTLVASIVSGIVATIATLCWQNNHDRKNQKIQIFKVLLAYRGRVESEECVNALNSIEGVFYSDEKVKKAWYDFLDETEKLPSANPNISDKHLKLLEEIAKTIGYKDVKWNDIKRSYYPTCLYNKISDENLLRSLQIKKESREIENATKQINSENKNQISNATLEAMLLKVMDNPEMFAKVIELGEKKK